ncbi:MAG: histidine kinase [Actinobacteria bacterium]|nr:histidine kinase [Actinomycetota bacterium]
MKRRKTAKTEPTSNLIPDGLTDVLSVIDAEYLVLAPGEIVLHSSHGTSALSLVKDGRLVSDPLVNLVRAVRRSGVYQEGTVELPRGPIGEGTHDLLVRVTPVGHQGLVVALIFDDSELRRLDSIRRDFVANISHELKTPIGALSILSEAVLGASDDPEAIVKFASRMQVEAKRLSDLVQEIINLSRLQDDDPLKNAKILNLTDLINEAIDSSRLAAEAREISIVFSSPEAIHVLGDRAQVEMAISNLIENAINYSPNGTRVAVALRGINNLAEISISDQGLGIPEKDLERIFERFYRVDPARSRATGGTGLGLSIVKHVVTNHGGDISVWSVEGSGSTFTIRLPMYVIPDDLNETNMLDAVEATQ